MQMILRRAGVPVVTLLWAVIVAISSLLSGLGSFAAPGSGLWPFLIACAMGVASIVVIVVPAREREQEDERGDGEESARPQRIRLLIGVASLAVFILIIPVVGMFPAVALLLLTWLRIVAEESWRLTAMLTIGVTAALWLCFAVLLKIPFPGSALPW